MNNGKWIGKLIIIINIARVISLTVVRSLDVSLAVVSPPFKYERAVQQKREKNTCIKFIYIIKIVVKSNFLIQKEASCCSKQQQHCQYTYHPLFHEPQ